MITALLRSFVPFAKKGMAFLKVASFRKTLMTLIAACLDMQGFKRLQYAVAEQADNPELFYLCTSLLLGRAASIQGPAQITIESLTEHFLVCLLGMLQRPLIAQRIPKSRLLRFRATRVGRIPYTARRQAWRCWTFCARCTFNGCYCSREPRWPTPCQRGMGKAARACVHRLVEWNWAVMTIVGAVT